MKGPFVTVSALVEGLYYGIDLIQAFGLVQNK